METRMPDKQLRDLVDAAVTDRLTEDQQRQLDARLRDDDAALAYYLAYCQLETDLHFYVRATLTGRRAIADLESLVRECARGGAPAAGVPMRIVRWQPIRHAPRSWMAAAAALLVVGLGAWGGGAYWQETPAERQPQPIGRLAEATHAEWLDDEGPAVGHEVVEGDFVYFKKGHGRSSRS